MIRNVLTVPLSADSISLGVRFLLEKIFEIVSFKALSLSPTVFLIGSGTIEMIQSLNCLNFCNTSPLGVGTMVGALKDAGIGSSRIFSETILFIVYYISRNINLF